MSVCIGLASITGAIVTATVGTVSADSLKTYIGFNYSPMEQTQFELEEPMGSFGIAYDVHKHVRLFAEHISTPMDCNDNPGINHAGVKLLAPINDFTLYSGISINHSGFDRRDKFNRPLGSIGIEYGSDVKVFVEYLTALENIDEGRAAIGVKVFFK